ncbi:PAS domain S-box protein [Fulvivirgaceae bacterium BMA10]|uniref:PAS domain S-box protein n=1 Tax=Splendidivirga corallicola TaxID=3051826 RepID=A0ABT8KRK8_9BACT|nr:PAS domain S-box protein [Fulvivirgaceae bacterium BMA10]
MFKKINIGSKITGLVLTAVLLVTIVVSFITFSFNKSALEKRHIEKINAIANLKKDNISLFFGQLESNIGLIQDQSMVKDNFTLLEEFGGLDADSITNIVKYNLSDQISPFARTFPGKLYVTDIDGKLLYTTDEDPENGTKFLEQDKKILSESKKGVFYSDIFKENGEIYLGVGAPLVSTASSQAGSIFLKINMDTIFSQLNDSVGLGETGEILLVDKYSSDKIIYLNPLKFKENGAFSKAADTAMALNSPILLATKADQPGTKYYKDYRGKNTLATWRNIPETTWGLVVKIDESEIRANSGSLLINFLIAGLVIMTLALVISILFSRILITPLLSLKETLQVLSKGILPEKVRKYGDDEIGQMAETTNDLVQALKRTASFAHQIGEGDFAADFQPLSDQDNLGNALINMRDSIQDAEKRDTERNWIVTGVAEIGEILRSHDTLNDLGDDVIAFVTNKIDAIQGAFYVVNDEDEENIFIEIQASYAYNKKKNLKGKFKFAEGLVGQSAAEQATILRTEIPKDYVSITSGILGDQRPSCILLVPLITEEKVYGILEFAGFNKFNPSQIKFVEEISIIIARTVFNIKVNERTRNLLEASQKMSHELQIQQEELQQNAEEMEATQEELRRSNQRLNDQIEEVNRTQKRMQLLLENASEVITIYEEDEKIRYISPSVENILGFTQNEMIGQKDSENIHPAGIESFHDMFKELIATPYKQITIQYKYKTKSEEYIWLEATGTNKLSDPAIQGIIVNSRDITERRLAEEEQRMRSKMQALSENSPDIITRLEEDGSISYINPMIETYAGHDSEYYLNKPLKEIELNDTITDHWLKILQDVTKSNEKVSQEMDFPSVIGDRIMQVNAIPEFDEQSKLESVLLVSHDITDRKLIELEIQSKNKKINDSINYAKRIQGAILPNTRVISQVLPQSFILYKAKDVVSGDFPWFMQVGKEVFIAAVDCTGHGVPGALISLIGYFLLNDIVRSRKINDPGQILDLLDEGVTSTLRQDQDDSRSKDGMDIALCKISVDKQEVEFAGAHRPLYFMKNGELEEIKGNKFAIGGGIYKNQTNFTNHKIKVKKGDSIYFCSDGFPDQFGGPENRKFGPKRTRELIGEIHKKDMTEVHKIMSDQWEDWKGEHKQTDDVLMIGIKF